MGPRKLYFKLNGDGYKISFDASKGLYDKYCVEFKQAVEYIREAGRLAARQGYLSNLNGRRRYFLKPDPQQRDKFPKGEYDPAFRGQMAAIERQGGNFLIQSVNADMTKTAMSKIRRFKKNNRIRTEFVNQVYDELVTCTHKDDSEDFHELKMRMMVEAAEGWIKNIPMEVDGEVKPYWNKG